MSVGYHNTGHDNLGIKIPPKTQNTIRQPGRPPGVVPSSMLGRPNPLQVPKGPNAPLAHGPTPKYGSSEASQAAEQSPPRPRPPRRGPWQHVASPPRPRVRGSPSESMRTPPSANWDCNPPTQRDQRIYCEPLRGVVRVSDGVRGHAAQRT